MIVSEHKQHKYVASEDGQRRMRVALRSDGLFQFFEDTFVIEDHPVASMDPLKYWRRSLTSGLYASAEEAEAPGLRRREH